MKSPVLACLLIMAPLAGCATDGRAYLTRTIGGASPEQVLEAAQPILRREFGDIAVNTRAGAIDARPAGPADDAGPAGDRRVARLRVARDERGALVRLRVDVERLDDRRATVLSAAQPDRFGDSPAWTPIERDAATTRSQNQVWTFVRRDRARERELLFELQEKFAGPPSPDAAATP